MPEAVNSHSITMPAGQPGNVSVLFDDVTHMLNAFSLITNRLSEIRTDISEHSLGFFLIHRLIMAKLDDAVAVTEARMEAAQDELDKARQFAMEIRSSAPDGSTVALALTGKLIQLVADVLTEEGREPINEADRVHIVAVAQAYSRKILEQVKAKNDMLEVGSLLPWAEVSIRRELGGSEILNATLLRDKLIVEQSAAGVPASEISQAFNMRRSTVDRIIGRLSGNMADEPIERAG